ncbi:tetratricopeptide repeat protein [Thermodesulfobacteriota bacterium]
MGKKSRSKRAKAEQRIAEGQKSEGRGAEPEKTADGFKIPAWLPLLLLAVAAGIRLVYLFENRTNPFFFEPVLDAANYDQWALTIAEGGGGPPGTFTANLFYPYLLSFIYRLLGHDLFVVRALQALAGTATCALIYLASSRIFGRAAGIAALGLSALYGPFISFEGELLAETWTTLFVSASLYLLSRSTPGEKRTGALLVLAGLTLGLAVLGRPNLLLFVPCAIAWTAWTFRDQGKRAFIGRAAALALGVAVAITPVTARNYSEGGEIVLITAHGGVNFFIGNNEGADGWFRTPPGSRLAGGQESLIESATRVAEKELGRKLGASEVSGYWFDRAFDFMAGNPAQTAGLLLKKLCYSWSAYEKPMVSNYYFNRDYSFALRRLTLGFGLVGPLALFGLAAALPMRRQLGWLYLFVGATLLSIVLFFVSSRYRIPMIPGLAGFAGFGAAFLIRTIRSRAWKRAARYGTVLVVLICIVNIPVSGKSEDMAHVYYLLGNKASERGVGDEAIQYFERAALMKADAFYLNNLGIAYKEEGRYKEAVEVYRRAISLNRRHRKPYLNLGVALRKLGRLEEAERAYLEAIKVSPGYAMAYHNLGNLYSSMGRINESITAYAKAIELKPTFTNPYYELARQYRGKGMVREEAETFERLVTKTKAGVRPEGYRTLWEYYRDVSPDPVKAERYEKRYRASRSK